MKKLFLFLAGLLMVGNAMAQCTASLSAYHHPSGNNLLRYDFGNISATGSSFPGKIVRASINYGDGNFGTFPATPWSGISHNYAAPGTYNLVLFLEVFDSTTSTVVCADTAYQTLTVAYRPCAFTIASTKVNDSTYTFTATNATSNPAATFQWWFGDGATGTGPSVTHSYPRSGSYIVSCYDTLPGCGYTNSMSQNVNFQGRFDCDSVQAYMYANVASRNVAISSGINPSFNYPGKSVSFTYNYGDGSPVTTSSTHAYSAVGVYNVKGYVAVSDSATSTVVCRDTLTSTANIYQLYASLGGYMSYDSVTYGPGTFRAWLIAHDTLAGTLTAIDSVTGSSYSYFSYTFRNVPAGRYLVKVASLTGGGGTGLLPTYCDSSLLWSGARSFNHNGVNNTWSANVHMRIGTLTSGPGFVGGSVALGANKGTASGAPGVSMILYTAAHELVAMTETDAQGNYSFSNIPVGTYSVLPELLNYDASSSVPFSITASSPTVNGISFTKDDTKMNIRASNLGVVKSAVSLVTVSPNPARNSVCIVADSKAGSNLELRDLSGKVIHRATIAAGAVLNLDVRSFPAGLYFLHAGSGVPVKLVIE